MFSYLLGFSLSLAVVTVPIFMLGGSYKSFFSGEGLAIVVGGTVSILLSAFPFEHVKKLFKIIPVLFKNEPKLSRQIVLECISLARKTRGERFALKEAVGTIQYHFLKDGVLLILDKLDDDLENILADRIRTKQEDDEVLINIFRKLGAFPPALGLLATVLALIQLLQNMGNNSVGIANLGPAMAVGLVGTLYGIVFSNLILTPVAENLALKSTVDARNRQIAMIGILLLSQKRNPLVVQETLNSLLPISERISTESGKTGEYEREIA
jgi:chemotaxis protein MotA